MSSGETATEPSPIAGGYCPPDVERRPHAEPPGEGRDATRPDVERQLREDAVVRAQRRSLDRRPADVARVVRLDAPPAAVVAVAVVVGTEREGRRDVVRRARVHALLHGGGEDERLEGRAGLPPCLREEVELVVRTARHDGAHRADRPGCRVDRDEGRGGVVRRRQRPADRVLRELLPAGLDRRVDAAARRSGPARRRTRARARRGRTRRSTAPGSPRRAVPARGRSCSAARTGTAAA